MNEYDLRTCRYIRDELRFVFFKDFYKERYILKRFYKKLDDNGKIFYKWYVYSSVITTLSEKNAIWGFLNNSEIEYEEQLQKIIEKYKTK